MPAVITALGDASWIHIFFFLLQYHYNLNVYCCKFYVNDYPNIVELKFSYARILAKHYAENVQTIKC